MSYDYFIFLFPYKTRGPSACDDAEEQFWSDSSRAFPSSKRLLFPQEGAQRSLHAQIRAILEALCDLSAASRGDVPGRPARIQPLIAGFSASSHRYVSANVVLKKFCIQLKYCSVQCRKYQHKFRERFNSQWNFWSCATSVDKEGGVV